MFPTSFHEIPQGMRFPLLMQAAIAKQTGNYGRSAAPPVMSSLAARQADAYARKAMRRDDARDAMQYSMERSAWRGGMPMGGGAMAMPLADGTSQFQPFQDDANIARQKQVSENTLLGQLMSGQPADPQMLRNHGLMQMQQAGQLFNDPAGMNAKDPAGQHQWDLEAIGALPAAGTTVNVGAMAPPTIQEQAQDAVLQREGKPTLWGQKNPELYSFGIRPDQSAAEVGRLIDNAAGKDVATEGQTPVPGTPDWMGAYTGPSSQPALSSDVLEKVQAYLRMRTQSEPEFYKPGDKGGFLTAPSTKRGLSFLDMLMGAQGPVDPEAFRKPVRETQYSPLGDKQYWENYQQVPIAPWDIFSTPR